METTICDEMMNSFLELDKGERIPLKVSLHLLNCKKCRSEVRALTKAEKVNGKALEAKTPLNNRTITEIVQKVDPNYTPEKNKVSFGAWIIAGILMIVAMLCFSIYKYFSRDLTIAFYMVFAGAVILYGLIFIAMNMDFFIKKISRIL